MNYQINKRSAREMVQFISDNLMVDESDLAEVYFKNYAEVLSGRMRAWFSANKQGVYSAYLKSYQVDTNQDVEAAGAKWRLFIEEKGVDYNDFLEYAHNQSMFKGFFRKTDNPNVFKGGSGSKSDLVQLLMTLQGMIQNTTDYSEAHQLMDKEGWTRLHLIDGKVGHLKVKTYLNGRVDIIGLTDQERAKLDTLFGIHEKLKNL